MNRSGSVNLGFFNSYLSSLYPLTSCGCFPFWVPQQQSLPGFRPSSSTRDLDPFAAVWDMWLTGVNAWGVLWVIRSCHATHAGPKVSWPMTHLEIATAGWPADKIFASHPYGSEPHNSFMMFHIIPFLSSRSWKLLLSQSWWKTLTHWKMPSPSLAWCLRTTADLHPGFIARHQPWVHWPKGFHRMPILCGICPQTWNYQCLGMDKPINKSGVDCDNLWTLGGTSSLISQTLLMSCWLSVLTQLEASLQKPFSFLGNCVHLWSFLDYMLSWWPGLQEAKSVKNLSIFPSPSGPYKLPNSSGSCQKRISNERNNSNFHRKIYFSLTTS